MSNKIKEVTVHSYNPDNYSSLKEAINDGNYSEIQVKAKEWDRFRAITHFASINHIGDHVVEIHHNDELLTKCGMWNLPKTLEMPPKYMVYTIEGGSSMMTICPQHTTSLTEREIKEEFEDLYSALETDSIDLSVCIDVGGIYAFQVYDTSYIIERVS